LLADFHIEKAADSGSEELRKCKIMAILPGQHELLKDRDKTPHGLSDRVPLTKITYHESLGVPLMHYERKAAYCPNKEIPFVRPFRY
jgi:hypothetical protein